MSLQNCIKWSGSGGTAEGALSKEEEYNEASQKVEIDQGSGIIVDEHFVVTNMHVIEDVMNDASKEVGIFMQPLQIMFLS